MIEGTAHFAMELGHHVTLIKDATAPSIGRRVRGARGRLALRAGMCLMPTQANGPELETDLGRANALNVEGTVRWVGGSVSLLGYRNKSVAGSYRATKDFEQILRQASVR